MSCVLDLLSNDVPHTFIGINGTRILIEFLFCFQITLNMMSYGIIQ